MGGEPGIADLMDAVDGIGNGGRNDKEVVHLPIACGPSGGTDDTTYLLEPPRSQEVLAHAIPIASDDPPTDQAGQGEGDGLQQVEVAFGIDPNLADEVHRAEVYPAIAHGGHPLHGEPASRMEVLRGGHRLGRRHTDEASGGNGGAD